MASSRSLSLPLLSCAADLSAAPLKVLEVGLAKPFWRVEPEYGCFLAPLARVAALELSGVLALLGLNDRSLRVGVPTLVMEFARLSDPSSMP